MIIGDIHVKRVFRNLHETFGFLPYFSGSLSPLNRLLTRSGRIIIPDKCLQIKISRSDLSPAGVYHHPLPEKGAKGQSWSRQIGLSLLFWSGIPMCFPGPCFNMLCCRMAVWTIMENRLVSGIIWWLQHQKSPPTSCLPWSAFGLRISRRHIS